MPRTAKVHPRVAEVAIVEIPICGLLNLDREFPILIVLGRNIESALNFFLTNRANIARWLFLHVGSGFVLPAQSHYQDRTLVVDRDYARSARSPVQDWRIARDAATFFEEDGRVSYLSATLQNHCPRKSSLAGEFGQRVRDRLQDRSSRSIRSSQRRRCCPSFRRAGPEDWRRALGFA